MRSCPVRDWVDMRQLCPVSFVWAGGSSDLRFVSGLQAENVWADIEPASASSGSSDLVGKIMAEKRQTPLMQ